MTQLTVEQIEQAKFDADNPAQAEMRLRRAKFESWERRNPIRDFPPYTGPKPEPRKPRVIDKSNPPGRKKVIHPPASDEERDTVAKVISDVCKEFGVSHKRLLASRRALTHPARRLVFVRSAEAGASIPAIAEIVGVTINSVRVAIADHRHDGIIAARRSRMEGRAA